MAKNKGLTKIFLNCAYLKDPLVNVLELCANFGHLKDKEKTRVN